VIEPDELVIEPEADPVTDPEADDTDAEPEVVIELDDPEDATDPEEVIEPEAVDELEEVVMDSTGMEMVVAGCLRVHTELLARPVVTDEAVVEDDVLVIV